MKRNKQIATFNTYSGKQQKLLKITSIFECGVSLRKTETNKQYGMVSAESKKDKRTVEQVQAEIRAKKLKRLEVG